MNSKTDNAVLCPKNDLDKNQKLKELIHGSALDGSDPHEMAGGFEVCQMQGTHIGASELTLFKSYEIGLLRIPPLCF